MAEEHHAAHPGPAQYVKIAIVLAVLTAFEVALFYINDAVGLGWINTALLLVLAFLKFVIVIGWYMHLRFEKSTLSRFFTIGFVLAFSLYAIVLISFGVLALQR
ncbi:MAG TPA: cytochrome C oxidase subunit IV family protein [Acidimicrobiia bacterium]|nr:cytochrome C oxidase subunit IV family protein [Acidimicrobiia bacterium]